MFFRYTYLAPSVENVHAASFFQGRRSQLPDRPINSRCASKGPVSLSWFPRVSCSMFRVWFQNDGSHVLRGYSLDSRVGSRCLFSISKCLPTKSISIRSWLVAILNVLHALSGYFMPLLRSFCLWVAL